MNRTRQRSMLVAAAFAFAACAGDGTPTGGGGGGGGTPTLSGSVQPILNTNCAFSGCHAGTSPQAGQNLSAGVSHVNIVGVTSIQSALLRVKAGEPDSSYLVHKIQGTQGTVGGSGGRMPPGGSLSQDNVDTIRAWIAAGALNN
jgi:hypothetical protein